MSSPWVGLGGAITWIKPKKLANFYLIPLLYRVIWTRVVSFFWSIYLSWKAHRELEFQNQPTQFQSNDVGELVTSQKTIIQTNYNNNNLKPVHLD